jgi:Ca-activated chloride channel homolog
MFSIFSFFKHPSLLAGLLLVPLLALLLWQYARWRGAALARWYRRPQAASGGFLRTLKYGLVLCAIGLLFVAWANPQFGHKRTQGRRQSADVLIALDLSLSMTSQDSRPSRLALARLFAQKLVQALRSHRVGVVFFAGETLLMLPPGDDHGAAEDILSQADPSVIGTQGTDLTEVIGLSVNFFDPESPSGKALVLITDCESHFPDADAKAKSILEENGIVTSTVGVGTTEGGTIPDPYRAGALLRDESGEIVTTKLDEAALRKIANSGGGVATHVREGDAAIESLKKMVNTLYKRDTLVQSDERDSLYQWLLLPAILMLWAAYWISTRTEKLL